MRPAMRYLRGGFRMHEIVLEDRGTIPGWVVDHASFRRWVYSEDYPQSGQYGWLNGKVWVDLSLEHDCHNQIKMRVAYTLMGLSDQKRLGKYWGDRMLLTHLAAGLSAEPDGMFATWGTLQENRARLIGGRPPYGLEIEGTPDMVLEVVSRHSVRKDYKELPALYWQAGIAEYWRIDPRGQGLRFDLLRSTAGGYRAVRARDGWRKSAVFGAAFRLTQTADPLGQPAYALAIR
jgi:Uma2 family endonuclease